MWLPTHLYARQADLTTASTRTWPNTTQPTNGESTSTKFPVAAIIIPVAVSIALFVGLVFYSWKRKMRDGLPPSAVSPSRHGRSGSMASDPNGNDGFHTIRAGQSSIPQDSLDSTTCERSFAQRLWHGFIWAFHVDRPDSHLANQEAQQDATAAQRRDSRARRRSRRRRDRHNNVQLRRTESGRSILTVPEYKSEVADGEVMLYKAIDDSVVNSTDAFDVTESPDDSQQQNTSLHRTVSQTIAAGLRNSFRRSMNRRPASRASRASSYRSSNGAGGDEAIPRPVELGPMDEVTETDSRPSVSIVIPEGDAPDYDALFPVQTRDGAVGRLAPETSTTRSGLGRFFRTHRASRSSPNATTVLPLTATSSTPARQHRRFNSSASVFSTLAGGSMNNSTADLHGQGNTPNVNGRPISQPLRSTLVHMTSSHRINEEQMRFLGSVESLGRYGLPFDGSSTRGSIDVGSTRRGAVEPPRYDYPTRPPPLLLASEGVRAEEPRVTVTTTETDNTDSSSFHSAGS